MLAFVEGHAGRALTSAEQADVLRATGEDGDSAVEFIDRFGKEFSIDMASYAWAFHHVDEGTLLRVGWPIPSGHHRALRFPLSVTLLTTAARTGQWPVRYPQRPAVASWHWLNWPLILLGLPAVVALGLWLIR